MKRTHVIVIATVLTLGAGGALAAYAGHHYHGWHRGEHLVAHLRDELDLTPEQTQPLQTLREQLVELRQGLRGERAQRSQELLALIAGPTLDQSRALALWQQKAGLLEQHAPQIIAALATFYDGLTPAQQAQVRELVEARLSRGRPE